MSALREELRAARARLQKCRDRMLWLREEMARIEAKIEADDYPGYQTESFRNDDIVRHHGHRSELERLEASERELEMDVQSWRNTIEAQRG
jgi:hypothetical protein